jgi:hypothetical protein
MMGAEFPGNGYFLTTAYQPAPRLLDRDDMMISFSAEFCQLRKKPLSRRLFRLRLCAVGLIFWFLRFRQDLSGFKK